MSLKSENIQQKHPKPGDLILVEKSEWYALKDGERLRVCEMPGWAEEGSHIYVAPRHDVRTFWGPDYGPPNGVSPERMSTSGGPFNTVKLESLEGLELIGTETDSFWRWKDWPRSGGGIERLETVDLWRCRLLVDAHFRLCKQHNVERGVT